MNESLSKALSALSAAGNRAASSAKSLVPEGARKALSGIRPGRLWEEGDARNAIIGSALGGLMLGGAGLAADRDPEESKYAPVGDALLGALLGGAAGYGIPKGLSMFSHPDGISNDPRKYTYIDKYITDPLKTGLGFAALSASRAVPALRRAKARLVENVHRTFDDRGVKLLDEFKARQNDVRELIKRKASPDEITAAETARSHAAARRSAYINDGPTGFANVKGVLEAKITAAKAAGNTAEAAKLTSILDTLVKERETAERGYNGFGDILNEMVRKDSSGTFVDRPKAGSGRIASWWNKFTNGSRYSPKNKSLSKTYGPGRRIVNRAGVSGLAGILLQMALNAALGDGVSEDAVSSDK